MIQSLANARVLTPDGWRDDLVVLLEGERIADLLPPSDPRVRDAQQHDLGGAMLVPGFIDVQVNGGGGVLFNEAPTVETLRRIGAAHRRFGTTGFLPTLISDRVEVMRAALAAVEQALAEGVPGVLGIHLEGPYLAPARKGVHDAKYFHAPNRDELALLCAPHRGVRLLTLAPDQVPTASIGALVDAGVIVCAGHTAADYATTRAALAAGVRGFTHLFNAMTPFGSREPGVVGAALEDADSWCGIIVDGHHVHPASLRVALAAKPRGKLLLVTDAMPPVGADRPDYVLNGETIIVKDGICQTAQGVLAGSALDMASAVRNGVEMLGLPLDEAVRMASSYAADFLGLGASHGRIAAGCRADLVALDDDYRVRWRWVGGVGE
ncbi:MULTISPECIES: N-acetylglucosamine-6-phosphate deacetylase [Rhodanobacter]|uniref:N-acetylglucosamine-6-phosphate deacetylase n=1 Tax=Rhodanobacter TaxID=75309 RepID=UPI0004263EB8|nr:MULTISPECIES: N-acetylglucosamine-6-phosphate deacetylase [Rhodanobacter]KZC18832.1 N-acetylglucosamine-6-phosphate deacetylase [Rhodanobacter denitrificans]UJJ51231.1 N-acetylglucosamine-6-phosphate deacetylase [Rhodanobacter denitrificans]UJJ59983.1 N-acetylglucosamine-6-phosphate deacetylase [Rhodanobacter denitrificans]UJM93979.1 N-acetylglucosamine-6-phosphate deacetylase [Rhodanobacter denitrificans]UJM97508.1 N-acetylglucosamine-6-phosphate deacetylase [Rhodanobacter denitrificans]